MKKPRLIVFDLDYTLWPFWVDSHVRPPFRRTSEGTVVDACNHVIHHYADVPQIFQKIKDEGIQIGLASRTTCIQEAKSLVSLFGWDSVASYMEIYPGSKIPHFKKFHQCSGIPFDQMLFFDDEHRNIRDVSKLGVTCVLAHSGMSMEVLHQGLDMFSRKPE